MKAILWPAIVQRSDDAIPWDMSCFAFFVEQKGRKK